jgi:hypothetical protein
VEIYSPKSLGLSNCKAITLTEYRPTFGQGSKRVIEIFQQELEDDSSLRLLFTDEFRLILAVFRCRKIIRELRDGRARRF